MKNKPAFIATMISAVFLTLAPPPLGAMAKTPSSDTPSKEAPREVEKLSLKEAFRLAAARSETIAISQEEIGKSRAAWFQAVGSSLADVNFVINDTRQEIQKGSSDSGSSVGSTFTASERRERKFTVSQPLFQGFRSLGAILGSGNLRHQREQETLRAHELLFIDVTEAYYTVIAHQKDVEVIEEIVALFEERLKDLEDREKIGRSRSSEVITAKSRMKMTEADLAKARGMLQIAKDVLEFYIGTPAENYELLDLDIPPTPQNLPEDLFQVAERRADVEAAKNAAQTAKNELLVAQGELWPQITLESNHYEKREGFQSGIDWDMLFKIDIPIGTGGETFGRVKRVYHNWKQAKLQYSLVSRQAELDIKQTFHEWVSAEDQHDALLEAVKAAEENYRVQEQDYLHNLVNNLDVLVALETLRTTRRETNVAYYALKLHYWRHQTALGNISESIRNLD